MGLDGVEFFCAVDDGAAEPDLVDVHGFDVVASSDVEDATGGLHEVGSSEGGHFEDFGTTADDGDGLVVSEACDVDAHDGFVIVGSWGFRLTAASMSRRAMSVSSASSGNSPRTRTWYAEDLVPRWLARFCAHLGVAMPRRWSSVPWMRWSARLARNAFSLERRALFSLGSGVRGNDVGFAGEGIVVAGVSPSLASPLSP